MWYVPLWSAACCIARLCGEALQAGRSGRPWRELSRGWYAKGIYLYFLPHLRLFGTMLTSVSLLVFCTILVMYCINCHHQLSIFATPCSPSPITMSSLGLTTCFRNASLSGYK